MNEETDSNDSRISGKAWELYFSDVLVTVTLDVYSAVCYS